MPQIQGAIKKILKDKDAGLKTGTQAMLSILEELQSKVIDELGRASLESFDYFRLKQMLPTIAAQIKNFKEKAELEAAGLLEKYWGMGQDLVDAQLGAAGIYTGFTLSTSSLDVLKDFTFHKIESLSTAAWDNIRSELSLGVMGQKTPQEVAGAIGKNLTDPSIFKNIATRAEVITETEMGRTFSQASQLRMEQAAQHVEGMEKMWVHAGHPKVPRPGHVAAHGQHVPVDQPFIVDGVPMMFPRDPGAPLKEVINCGCDHVPYHKDWE